MFPSLGLSPTPSLSELFYPRNSDRDTAAQQQQRQRRLRGRPGSPSPLSSSTTLVNGTDGAQERSARSASPLVRHGDRYPGFASREVGVGDGIVEGVEGDFEVFGEDGGGDDDEEDGEEDKKTQGKTVPSPRTPPLAGDGMALHRSASLRKGERSRPNSPNTGAKQASPSSSIPTTPTRTSGHSINRAGSPASYRPGAGSPTLPVQAPDKPSHRSLASVASTKSATSSMASLSPSSSIEGSPVREGPKLSSKNQRRLRKRKTETDADHALYSMNPTSGSNLRIVSASTNDLPRLQQLQRVKSIGGASTVSAASAKTTKSVSSAFSSVSKRSIALPTMPWLRQDKGENLGQLMDSGFFERTALPPKKITRLPVLAIAPIDVQKAQAGRAAERGSVLLTPTAFYDNKRQSVRFSWNVKPEGDGDGATTRNVWIPANRFSWAIREKNGIISPTTAKRLSSLLPIVESEAVDAHDGSASSKASSASNRLSWSLYETDGSNGTASLPSSEQGDVVAEGQTDAKKQKRRSWMLNTGSPSKSPQEVRVLAAVPETLEEGESEAGENDPSSSSYEGWPLRILAPDDVPERAEVLAVIAEEDEDEVEGGLAAGESQDSDESQWPMVVMSPGLPPLKVVGMATIDGNEDEDGEKGGEEENNTEEEENSSSTADASQTPPHRNTDMLDHANEETKMKERVIELAPYTHGPIRMQRPSDLLQNGTITDMGLWSEDSTAASWGKTEAALVEGILDFFSTMIGTSEVACGATETASEGGSADSRYLSAPLLDDALIQQHARGDFDEVKKEASRPPPPLPPLPPSLPALPPMPPSLPPVPPTPDRPESLTMHRPSSLARSKSTKGNKSIQAPSFGSLLLKRNIF